MQDFYEQCGHQIIFVRRFGFFRPRFGYTLYFSNGHGYSYAEGRIASISYIDWTDEYSNCRPSLVIHELNHPIFNCPDHYEGAEDYEPCYNLCMMRSPEEGTVCANCFNRIRSKHDVFPLIAVAGIITAPIWFPIIADWLSRTQGSAPRNV